jgi:hypothetical protein
VLKESSIGMIVTDGDPASNLDNTVVGVDFRYLNSGFRSGRGMDGEVWVQQSDSEGIVGDDQAMGFRLRMPASVGIRAGLGASRYENNFNPAMGFVRRTGIEQFNYFTNYQWRPSGGSIRTISTGMDFSQISYLDNGDVQSEQLSFNLLNVSLNSQDQFGLNVTRSKEGLRDPFNISSNVTLQPGVYTFESLNLNLRTGNQRKFGTGVFLNDGEFWNGERFSAGGF